MNVPEGMRYGLYILLSVAHLPSVNKSSNDIKKIKSMIRQTLNVMSMSVSRWSQKVLLHVSTKDVSFPSAALSSIAPELLKDIIVQNVEVTLREPVESRNLGQHCLTCLYRRSCDE